MEQVEITNQENVNNSNIISKNPSAYLFKLDSFEGPLDLLLHLIKKNKIDIYDIPVAEITKQYMKIITNEKLKDLDLDIAGEYLLMASTLAQIKSKMLLPIEDNEDDDLDDFEKDPRNELVIKLLEYQRFKDVAAKISSLPKFREDTYPLGNSDNNTKIEKEDAEISSEDVDIFSLLSFFHNLVTKLPEDEPHDIEEDTVTVSQRIIEVLNILSQSEFDKVPFSGFFTNNNRSDIIVTFLSILELNRLKYIRIYQPTDGEIWITKNFNPDEIDMNLISSIEATYSESKTFLDNGETDSDGTNE